MPSRTHGRLLATLLLATAAPLHAQTSEATRLTPFAHPLAYRIALTPDATSTTFTANESIDLTLDHPTDTLTLDAFQLTLLSATVANNDATITLDAATQTATLHFAHSIPAGPQTLTLAWTGGITAKGSSLFPVNYKSPSGDRQLLATQFEFVHARRVFPCWDSPSAKATFTLTVTLPADEVVLSNTPITSQKPSGAGDTETTFATTPRMSPYLLVLVAGHLEALHAEAANTKLSAWTTEGRSPQAKAALDRAQQLLPLYNTWFAASYPLPKLDLIAIPHLGFDAMENWGGITFAEDLLLWNPASSTPTQLQAVQHLVGHEIAHQWFGDLVTTATWNDVWLNESFAEWMSYKSTELLNPDQQPWLNFHAAKKRAMDTDAGPSKAVVGNPFDANTSYRKGPAILHMIEAYIGPDAFQTGIRNYIHAHAYANATTADLWSALEQSAGKPITSIARSFTDQPGLPLVNVATTCDHHQLAVTLTQQRFTRDYPNAPDQTWRIPIRIADVSQPASAQTIVLDATPLTLHFPTCTAAIKANLGDTGYFRVRYDAANHARLASAFAQLSPADRVSFLSDEWALVQSSLEPAAAYLDLTRHLSAEDQLVVWTDIVDVLKQIDTLERGNPTQTAFRAYAASLLQPEMQRLGWDPQPNDSTDAATLRPKLIATLGQFDDPATLAEARRRFAAFATKSTPLPVTLRAAILETIGRHADAATYDQLHSLAQAATDDDIRRDLYWAMASAQDPALIDRTVTLTTTKELPNGDAGWLLVTAAQRSDADRLCRDVAHLRTTVLGGAISKGLLQELAGHALDPNAAAELLQKPAPSTPEPKLQYRTTLTSAVSAWLADNATSDSSGNTP